MDTHKETDRENVGRIDHSVFIYRNEESQKKAREHFSTILGIDDWDELVEADQGVHIFISWNSGIELICPTKPIPAYERHLDKQGEGFYAMVFGVADLDEAMVYIEKIEGCKVQPLGPAPCGVFNKFDIVREAIIGKIGGVRVMIGEFKKKD